MLIANTVWSGGGKKNNTSSTTKKPTTQSKPAQSSPSSSYKPATTTQVVQQQAPQVDYASQIMDYYQRAQNRARDAAISSLQASLNANLKAYDNQLSGLGDQYQQLRNQSEVERYKAMKSVREALANRGQLDSGLGRQETLNLNTQYGNAINNINLQEQKAREELEAAKNQLRAQYQASLADIESAFANTYLSGISDLF